MALHHRIGQLALVGFDGFSVPAEIRSLAREFDLGGLVLFRRNVESPEQVAQIAWDTRQMSQELPPWVAMDQEGGRVARVRQPLTVWPAMSTLGRSGDEDLAARFARALAAELAVIGVSLDFAPVLDVLTNPDNPAIGDRSLGDRPEQVARLGAAIVRGLQAGGVAACGKHFPGHGEAGVDSHLELPVVDVPPDRLRAVELVPFRAAIEAEVCGIMTAHLLVPALDDARPATISPAIVGTLLRDELGFGGLVFTDDLDMKGISGDRPRERAFVEAIAAGCDVGLLCGTDVAAHCTALEALVHAVEQGELAWTRVESALDRQRRAKGIFASRGASIHGLGTPLAAPLGPDWRPPASDVLRRVAGCDEHQLVASEMRQYA